MNTDDRCTCPKPSTCPYCSRMYPCDCSSCPLQSASERHWRRQRQIEADGHRRAAARAARITGCLDEDEEG